MVAITAGQWVLIGFASVIALIGISLVLVNLAPLVLKRRTPSGESKALIGRPQQLTRRKFFGRALFAGFGASMLSFGGISLAFLWPTLRGGFGGIIALDESADGVKSFIDDRQEPFYFPTGRFYLVRYDADGPGSDVYFDEGLVADGLMALYQKCPHLGCRVPFCETSQWFECPCHGSKYNRAGEWREGPAPRGLDRFPIRVEDGVIIVDTGLVFQGPVRGTNSTGQDPEGPFCIDIVGEEE